MSKITFEKIGVSDYSNIIQLPVEEAKKALRQLRDKECFAITDRPLWYNGLLQEQKDELNAWYEKWLDITETFEIPTKPSWL